MIDIKQNAIRFTVERLKEAGVNSSISAAGVPVEAEVGNYSESRNHVFICTRCDSLVLSALQGICAKNKNVMTIMVLEDGAREPLSWPLIQHGAADVVVWDCKDDPSGETIVAVAERLKRWQEVDTILDGELVRRNLIGDSPAWRAVLRQLIEISCFTTDDILLHGESGTGKELVTQLVHTIDRRQDKRDLIIVDCTTLVPELIGSELFGHERGAFTGAALAREGAFALADQGSLFLDEIGELPITLQAQLLRVVQERSFKRVGGNRWQPSHFRLVCATHRDLQADVAAGRFRHDLYWRIATHVVTLPPLRERREDVIPLARHFMAELLPGGRDLEISPPVQAYLLNHAWPGNIRQLRQCMARICARHVGRGPITIGDLPPTEWPTQTAQMTQTEPLHPTQVTTSSGDEWEQCVRHAMAAGMQLKDLGRHAQDIAFRIAIDEADGNLQRAAVRLGVSDRTVQLWRAQTRVDAPRSI